MEQNWMNHPGLSGIDPAKLQMLQSMAAQGAGKSPNDLLPFLMAAANSSQKSGMQFSNNEIETIIQVMKMGKSPAETAKIDQMLSLARMMKKK